MLNQKLYSVSNTNLYFYFMKKDPQTKKWWEKHGGLLDFNLLTVKKLVQNNWICMQKYFLEIKKWLLHLKMLQRKKVKEHSNEGN